MKVGSLLVLNQHLTTKSQRSPDLKRPGSSRQADFWSERYSSLGHTGWNDPFIYAYDQLERLEFLATRLDLLAPRARRVLDFGCGTGDFSRLLLRRGCEVCGYDPYVDPRIDLARFTRVERRDDLDRLAGTVDLVLTVTVLDHLLDEEEFCAALSFFRSRAADGGHLLMMEYAPDTALSSPNRYQAFRSIADWKECLAGSGWEIQSVEPVPHPLSAPSSGFMHFSQRPLVRLLKRLGAHTPVKPAHFGNLLNRYARKVLKTHGPGEVESSPLKLICCRRT